jgi:hypothetical protein
VNYKKLELDKVQFGSLVKAGGSGGGVQLGSVYYSSPVCFCVSKAFLIKFENFLFFY